MEKEEAIKVIRKNYPHVSSSGSEFETALRAIIPELVESEDERIRKAIIHYILYETKGTISEATEHVWVNWLEKQKDLDKMIVVSPEVWDMAINDAYKNGKKDNEKQKEQKPVDLSEMMVHKEPYIAPVPTPMVADEQRPAEWSEDYREEDIQTRFAFYTYKDDPSVLYLSNVFVEEASRNHGFGTRVLKAAEKAAEAIGAITIRLKVKQDSPANAWYRKCGYGYVTFEDGYDWLEKNLEYLKPAKQEWSEEDEEMRLEAIRVLVSGCERYRKESGCLPGWHKVISWLKSLRPQLSDEDIKKIRSEEYTKGFNDAAFGGKAWKPSEEQIKAIESCFCEFGEGCPDEDGLRSLYNDLKKLM